MKTAIKLILILLPFVSFSTSYEVSFVYKIEQKNDTTFKLSIKRLNNWTEEVPEYTFFADSIIDFKLCNDNVSRVNIWTNRGFFSAAFDGHGTSIDLEESMIEYGAVYNLKTNCYEQIYQTSKNINNPIYFNGKQIDHLISDSIVGFNFIDYSTILLASFEGSTQAFHHYKGYEEKTTLISSFSSASPFTDILQTRYNSWIGISQQPNKSIIYNSRSQQIDTILTKISNPMIARNNWFGSDTIFFTNNHTLFYYNESNSHVGSSLYTVDSILNTSFLKGDYMNQYIPFTRAFIVQNKDSIFLSLQDPDNTIQSFGHKDSTWVLTTYDDIGGIDNVDINEKKKPYPNPAINNITLPKTASPIQSVEIYNSRGTLISKENTSAHTINVKHLASGHYIINIITLEKVHKSTFIKL